MTVRTCLFSLLLSFAISSPSFAQPEDEEDGGDGPEADTAAVFDLDRIIQIAVQHSPEMTRAKLERENQEGLAGAARADQQWQLKLAGEYKKVAISPQAEVTLFTPVDTDTISAAIALGRNLPTGGRVDLEGGQNMKSEELLVPQDGTFEAIVSQQSGMYREEFSTVHQTSLRLSYKQPIVRGFGPDVALANQARADLQFTLATLQAQLQAEEMIRDLVTQYWELAYANHEVDTRNQAVVLAEAQEKITRDEVRVGKSPQSALSAVVYAVNSRKEQLLKAQIDAEKKSLDFRRRFGLGLDKRNIMMRPGHKFEIGRDEWDIDETLSRARKANRKMATIALQRKIAEVDLKVAKNGILPQVDVNLSGALVGSGNDTGESFGAITDGGGYEVTAGLQIGFDLSGAARSNYEASLARRRKVDLDREDAERQIEAEVINAVKAVTFARARVVLADKAIAAADESWKSERNNFQANKTTNYSVMQRQGEFIEAQLSRGRAVVDYHISVANLQYLSGVILEQYRINVKPKASRD